MTRVLINLTWLVPGVVGGSEESTTDTVRALIKAAPSEFDFELAVLEPFLEAHPDLAEQMPCHLAPFGEGNKALRILAEQTWLARLARSRRAGIVHHAGGVVPLVHPGRVVLTIHDLQPVEYPENFMPSKRRYLNAMLGRSVKSADVIAVPSRFTGERVRDLLGVAEDRIVEVPWSVSQRIVPEWTDTNPLEEVDLYPGWSPERRFILYPAITYPHKRHILLVDAFARLTDTQPDLDMVLTGGYAQMEGKVLARMSDHNLTGRVHRLGRVPLNHLERLYAAASAVVIPSSYEGFGLPALEAMSRGVPVLGAKAGSLTELLEPAWLVEGDDPELWHDRILALLNLSEADRSAWRDRGREIAATFTPERTAEAALGAYRLALGQQANKT
ncbi:MAG: glycosyltransferase family 1 protein [Microthrixaceae bacterium]